ncbi:alpha/beta hydrolase [Pseudomonas rubra]|uniref:Dienelactone hydrolase family protein n=1 Tax=Pseudomonas rubra TaxID=2942627 RepID=A0ABT5P6V1_9PSED|nr:dienelactone hydrolase family protein [Pseudomonas rubra]MDD1013759.1 dienelactone hydrolase family protein [Pseudomonas rubra]MDD1039713.1 dienelactone hydrolase family protein [Pseudomonas rubra]MDD1153225.1 dienelactone hydrolase family protein [Pseudomonas rubra]
MSLLTATRLHLCSFGLLAGLSLAATTAYADEASDQALHKGRWQGMAAMANLYLNDATPAEFMDAGDKEKSEHDNYAGALAFYLTAARLDPKNAFAAYQAAAALSAMDSPELAAQYLDEARERGFWQTVILKEDDELEPMQKDPAYQKLLQAAEKNYPSQAKDAGLAAFSIPQGKAPAGGWPVVVWLAGFGTEGVNGTNMRADLVGEKAVLVALNGTLKRDNHQFMWQRQSVEPTEQAVAAALKKLEKDTRINRSKVALIGFSQGAEHAAHLIAQYPQNYSGAVLLSPGGFKIPFTVQKAKDKRLVVVHGAQEHESNLQLTASTEKAFTGNNQVQSHEHPEGHTFQDDWRKVYPGYLDYALGL